MPALDTPPAGLAGAVAALRCGALRPTAYVELLCDRIDRLEPVIRALLPEPDRRARLRREAEALEARFPNPDGRPPLFGVPVGVKDIFRVDGFETRAGSSLPPELFAGPEASAVRRLRGAGALILAKTVTTEFAYFEPGPTRNPRDPQRTPGGSSSGSAAAVAAGFCPLALGTQTVGSVIRPAAFCGVVGFKPSYGRAPLDGVVPFSPSADHLGLFTPDAEGMRLAAALLLDGPDETEAGRTTPGAGRPLPAEGIALGVPEGPYLQQASGEALAAFEEQLARLRSAGIRVLRVPALDAIDRVAERHRRLIAAEFAAVHADWFAAYGDRYRPRTAALIREGRTVTPEDLEEARAGRLRLRAELHALMDAAGVHFWVCPAATGPAPTGLDSTGDPAMNLPWTHAGLPVLALPAGLSRDGLPLGLQLVARFGADEELLAAAPSLEGALAGTDGGRADAPAAPGGLR